jgi:hypothetical protein
MSVYTALMTQISGLQLSNPSYTVTVTVKRKAKAFVDDTDLWVNATMIDPTEFPDKLILKTETPDPVTVVVITRITPSQAWYKRLGNPPRSKRIPNRRVRSQDSKGNRHKTSHVAFPALPQQIYDST